jgi:hypothetical protein
VLFDQGTPVPFRRLLSGHTVSTAFEMGWGPASPNCHYPATLDDVVGSLYCGDAGNDTIFANGPAHQCIDGGPHQTANPDCFYLFGAGIRSQGAFDLGTSKRCAHPLNVSNTLEPCGCE